VRRYRTGGAFGVAAPAAMETAVPPLPTPRPLWSPRPARSRYDLTRCSAACDLAAGGSSKLQRRLRVCLHPETGRCKPASVAAGRGPEFAGTTEGTGHGA